MPNGDLVPIYKDTMTNLLEGVKQADLGVSGGIDLNYPIILISEVSDTVAPTSPVNSQLSQDRTYTTQQVDTLTKQVGVLDYAVVKPDIKAGTTVIVGTYSGTPNTTFVLNTDYEVLDLNADTGLETIRWKTGGGAKKPDDGTQFTVTYQHYTPREWYGEESATQVQVHALAVAIKSGDTLTRSPVTTAQKDHTAEEVLRTMLMHLKGWAASLDIALAGLAGTRDRGPIQDFSHLEGEGVLRKGFDITLHYNVRAPVDVDSLLAIDVETGLVIKVDEPLPPV